MKRLSTDIADRADGFDLDAFLPYLVNVLAARLSGELGRRYGHEFGISIPEWRVLAHLSQHERVSVREIYARVAMDKVKVSRAAARLEEAGLIAKARPDEDRRLVSLSLTRKGRAVFAEVAEMALGFEAEFFSRLSEEEAATFRRLVGKLLDRREAAAD